VHCCSCAQATVPAAAAASSPTQVVVSYDYRAATPAEMTVKAGQVLMIVNKTNADWWEARALDAPPNAKPSLVPASYVAPVIQRAKAAFDFKPAPNDEATQLSLKEGDLLYVTKKLDAWFEGSNGSRLGLFPVDYVKVMDV